MTTITRIAPARPQIHPVTLLHNPYQQAFLAALAARTADGKRQFHRLAVLAGRRGGKSLIGALAAVREAAVPGTVGWACAPSYPQLHDYVIPAIRQFLPPELGSAKSKIWSESHMEFALPWGSLIQCRSLDDPERGRGPGLHWCWIDEARGVTEKAWMTLLPALTDKPGVCWITSTPNEYDWCYRTFYKPAIAGRPGYWACRYRTIDNPSIQAEEIADAKLAMTPEFYQQEYEADFVSFTGAVYGNYITPQVVSIGQERTLLPEWPAIDPSRPAIVGLDMGTDHPFGAVLLVGTPLGYVVVGEYFARHQPLDTHIRQIRAMARGLTPRYVYDRTAQQLGIELAQQGFYAEPSNSDVLAGIRRVEAWLVSRKLWFFESAVPVTIQQHRAYRWAENTDVRGAARKERVYKVEDEATDCTRYALMAAGELPEPAAARTGRDPATVPEISRWAWEREQRSGQSGWTHDEERGTGEFYL